MLLVTDKGHYFTVVEDIDDPEMLWVRSQDKESIEHASNVLSGLIPIPDSRADYEVIDEPEWDYQYRIRVTRPLWGMYLQYATDRTRAHKLKPAVAAARGTGHPVSKMVYEVFMFMSENRPDGSLPAWLGGERRKKGRTW